MEINIEQEIIILHIVYKLEIRDKFYRMSMMNNVTLIIITIIMLFKIII